MTKLSALLPDHLSLARNPRFWAVQLLVLVIAVVHSYLENMGALERLGAIYFLPISVYWLPVIIAALLWGSIGSLPTAIFTLIVNILDWTIQPHINLLEGEILLVVIAIAVAIILSWQVDKRLKSQREQATFAAYILRSQEMERKSIGDEIHDDATQKLVVLCYEIDDIKRSPNLDSKLTYRLNYIRQLTEEIIDNLGQFTRDMHLNLLEDFGVIRTIRSLFMESGERAGYLPEFKCSARTMKQESRLNDEVKLVLLRIIQEALRNIERHSCATKVCLSMAIRGNTMKVDVIDDGTGINKHILKETDFSKQIGLIGMRQRAELVGGTLKVVSRPGKGTHVAISLPIVQPEGFALTDIIHKLIISQDTAN